MACSVMQNYGPGHVCLLPFLTHFADLSSWEYAKKLKAILPQIEAANIQVRVLLSTWHAISNGIYNVVHRRLW